jgi:hypothetical protein
MKAILVFLLALISYRTFAQEKNQTTEQFKNRWIGQARTGFSPARFVTV